MTSLVSAHTTVANFSLLGTSLESQKGGQTGFLRATKQDTHKSYNYRWQAKMRKAPNLQYSAVLNKSTGPYNLAQV